LPLARGDPARELPRFVRPRAAVILAPVRPDGSPSSLREALAVGWRELALYVAAGFVYIAIGIAEPEFLFTWVVAAGYLVLCIVVLPFAVGRVRARRR
jgi:hypothetical protein